MGTKVTSVSEYLLCLQGFIVGQHPNRFLLLPRKSEHLYTLNTQQAWRPTGPKPYWVSEFNRWPVTYTKTVTPVTLEMSVTTLSSLNEELES